MKIQWILFGFIVMSLAVSAENIRKVLERRERDGIEGFIV